VLQTQPGSPPGRHYNSIRVQSARSMSGIQVEIPQGTGAQLVFFLYTIAHCDFPLFNASSPSGRYRLTFPPSHQQRLPHVRVWLCIVCVLFWNRGRAWHRPLYKHFTRYSYRSKHVQAGSARQYPLTTYRLYIPRSNPLRPLPVHWQFRGRCLNHTVLVRACQR
jgi:hypothetical protein